MSSIFNIQAFVFLGEAKNSEYLQLTLDNLKLNGIPVVKTLSRIEDFNSIKRFMSSSYCLFMKAGSVLDSFQVEELKDTLNLNDKIVSVSSLSNLASVCSFPKPFSNNSVNFKFDNNLVLKQEALIQVPCCGQTCILFKPFHKVDLFFESKGFLHLKSVEEGLVGYSLFLSDHNKRNYVNARVFVSNPDLSSTFFTKFEDLDSSSFFCKEWESSFEQCLNLDPLRAFRFNYFLKSISALETPLILNVLHSWGGGTQKLVEDLENILSSKFIFLQLKPVHPNLIALSWAKADYFYCLYIHTPSQMSMLCELLKLLQLQLIHFHHTIGVPETVLQLPSLLQVPYYYSAHDFYSVCPRINLAFHEDGFCNMPDVDTCSACLLKEPVPFNKEVDIVQWRNTYQNFISKASKSFTPSIDTKNRILHFIPSLDLIPVPHLDIQAKPNVTFEFSRPPNQQQDKPLKIVVLGVVTIHKGLKKLEAVQELAKSKSIPLEFKVIGFTDPPCPSIGETGAYLDSDLDQILKTEDPDIVWFPVICPETFSFTLSAAIRNNLPIVAPNIGSFSERLVQRKWTWIIPWNLTADRLLSFFLDIKDKNFKEGVSPSALEEPNLYRYPNYSYYTDYGSDLLIKSKSNIKAEIFNSLLNEPSKIRLNFWGQAYFMLKKIRSFKFFNSLMSCVLGNSFLARCENALKRRAI